MERSRLNYFAMFLAGCTFFLIVAGAMVTSTGSGLAVPDWPLSFGQFFPTMKGGVLFEHGHRLIAGAVGILTLIQCVWLWMKEERRWLCWLGTAALGAVIVQAALGGITVLYGLPPWVSTAHATLAQAFFCMTIAMAYFTRSKSLISIHSENQSAAIFHKDARALFRLSASATAFIFIQLVLGSALRHGGGQVFLEFHLIWAAMVMAGIGMVFSFAVKKRDQFPSAVMPALLLILGLITQIALGLIAVFPMYGKLEFLIAVRTPVITAHVATGAFLLGISFLLTLIQSPFRALNFDRAIVSPIEPREVSL